MALDFLDRVELPEGTATALDVRHLKNQIRTLVHERDRAVTRVEHLEQSLEHERAARRHSLAVFCDQCNERLTITCGKAPTKPGAHASALKVAAVRMGWWLGATTLGTLAQLIGVAPDVAPRGHDLCPECVEVERVAAQQ